MQNPAIHFQTKMLQLSW